jgi:hypothetical protein
MAERFEELLNTETSNQNTINRETHQALSATDETFPTIGEVNNDIQKHKNNKAHAIDPILIKKASLDHVELIHQLTINS